MNIYLPDDLAAEIRAELGEANISGIAQNALRVELARARGLQEALGGGDAFRRVEAVDGDEDVAFQGRKIASDDGRHLTVYLTPKGNIAVVDGRENGLYVYDETQAFIDDYSGSDRPGTQEMVRQVAKALGLKSVRELDI
jgi:hypothetical protein